MDSKLLSENIKEETSDMFHVISLFTDMILFVICCYLFYKLCNGLLMFWTMKIGIKYLLFHRALFGIYLVIISSSGMDDSAWLHNPI